VRGEMKFYRQALRAFAARTRLQAANDSRPDVGSLPIGKGRALGVLDRSGAEILRAQNASFIWNLKFCRRAEL